MELLNKKVSMEIWKLLAFIIVVVGFITLAIVTDNITVSDNFVTVIGIITSFIVGSITIGVITRLLLNHKDSIIEFLTANITKVIIILIVILIATLLSGCLYQVSIGAMQETVLDNIIVIEFSAVLFVFTATITNIIRLFNTKKIIKKKARMHKLASLMTKQNIATTHTNHTNHIEIKALVTDLYCLSVQDITTVSNVNVSALYNAEIFMSLLNETTTSATKELGFFQNSLDFLVSNHYISTMEAATAKVVTFDVDREVLLLL